MISGLKQVRRWVLDRSPARLIRQYRAQKASRSRSTFTDIMPSLGMKMTIDPTTFFSRVYVVGGYETSVERFLRQCLKPGFVCIDVGANVGYYTLLFSKRVGTSGQVYAFEPSSQAFALLKRNIKLNSLQNVRAEQTALFDSDGQIEFHEGPPGFDVYNSAGVIEHPAARDVLFSKTKVPCTRFDKYRADHALGDVDLIKIDVEGAELHVLMGMEKTLMENPHATLVLEYLDTTTKGFGYSRAEIGKWLTSRGWSLSRISRYGKLEPAELHGGDETLSMVVARRSTALLFR